MRLDDVVDPLGVLGYPGEDRRYVRVVVVGERGNPHLNPLPPLPAHQGPSTVPLEGWGGGGGGVHGCLHF